MSFREMIIGSLFILNQGLGIPYRLGQAAILKGLTGCFSVKTENRSKIRQIILSRSNDTKTFIVTAEHLIAYCATATLL